MLIYTSECQTVAESKYVQMYIDVILRVNKSRGKLCQLNVVCSYCEELKVNPLFANLPTLFGAVASCLNSIIQGVKGSKQKAHHM